jgi:hypothetical protein
VVELGDIRDRLESLFKVGDLFERVTELDDRGSLELSRWVLKRG